MLSPLRPRALVLPLSLLLLLSGLAGAQPVDRDFGCASDYATPDLGGDGDVRAGQDVPGGGRADAAGDACLAVSDEDLTGGDWPLVTSGAHAGAGLSTSDAEVGAILDASTTRDDGGQVSLKWCHWIDCQPDPPILVVVFRPPRGPEPICTSCPAYAVEALGGALLVEGQGVESLRLNGVELLP